MKPTKEQQLQRAKDYAKSRNNGECLSTEYVTVKAKLHWKCSNPNHPSWYASGEIISRNVWCPLCGREEQAKKATLSDGLQRAHAHAAKKGGWCLSTEYKNAKTKLKWQCEEGHEWDSCFDHAVTRNRWCLQCEYDKAIIPDAYEKALNYVNAENRKGSFNFIKSDKIKAHTLIEWQCDPKNNHKTWKAEFGNVVIKGGWCRYCAGKFSREEYLQMAKEFAISKKWTCISEKYIDQKTPMQWNCEDHGDWIDNYKNVVDRNGGCRKCREKLTPEEYLGLAKQHALRKGGECISNEYIKQNDKLVWKCHKHGQWESDYGNIVSNNRWCPTCYKEEQKARALKKAHDYAKKFDGECLTNIFNSTEDLFEWKCSNQLHPKWGSKYNTVLGNKSWCPECGIYYQKENQNRKLLEYLLGFSLEKAKPEWNVNPETGNLLELDGYNKDYKIAFEYQGRQHYQDNVFTNQNQSLEVIQFKDKVKAQHCLDRGITLIIIDGRKKRDTSKRMLNFLQGLLDSYNLSYKKNIDLDEVEKIFNAARIEKCDNSK